MGRKQESKIRKYFSYCFVKKESSCGIEGCNAIIKGNHATNLERHMERCHHDEYGEYIASKNEHVDSSRPSTSKRKRESNDDTPIPSTKKIPQPTIDSIFNPTITIEMSAKKLKDACLDLVTINGRPFTLMEDTGFRKIIDPILKPLNAGKQTVAINSENVRGMVRERATEIRSDIADEVRGKLVSLKIDGATRMDRSIMGVNIQFIKNGKLEIRTLALTELLEKHTALNIKEFIVELARKYNIDPDQLYSITTDNGANMVKAVDILVEELESVNAANAAEIEGNKDSQLSEDVLRTDASLCEKNDENYDGDGDEERQQVRLTSHEMNDVPLINSLEVESEDLYLPDGVAFKGVRCAAHTLQLAVDDAIKAANVSHTISKARNVVKKLRTQNFLTVMKKLKLNKPIIDCVTRWHSTVEMLIRLLELKDFCTNMAAANKDLQLSAAEWVTIKNVVEALMPAKITTKILQSEQLTMGDFFIVWLKCQLDTKKVNTSFSDSLVLHMKRRESKLFENEAFLSAIFLDPRVQVLLTAQQKELAKSHLATTWARIENVKRRHENSETENLQHVAEHGNAFFQLTDTEDELEQLLKAASDVETQPNSFGRSALAHITSALASFENTPRLDKKANVLTFWEENKLAMPELYELAQIALAVPATQVSVERLFSGMKFILSHLRASISSNILEDILIVRSNSIFIKKSK